MNLAHLNDKRSNTKYTTNAYGGSIVGLYNPLNELQLSVELEGLQVNRTASSDNVKISDNFFQEALFVGAGYRVGNVIAGVRYNLLHKKDNNIYGAAALPFVRVYF